MAYYGLPPEDEDQDEDEDYFERRLQEELSSLEQQYQGIENITRDSIRVWALDIAYKLGCSVELIVERVMAWLGM